LDIKKKETIFQAMSPAIPLPFPSIDTFQRKLLHWYNKHKRNLPWRINPTPYRVWISEIMLQQTQVSTVIPYYINFLNRFPDLRSLARASEQEVLELWSGLGYYSRARNLLKTATIILNKYGEFPKIFHILITLPGIGQYTAGAICSIAFNQAQPAVDGNIRRVLTRINGIQGGASESFFRDQMEFLIPKGQAASFTQAMMELGALICAPSLPKCSSCPIKTMCVALKLGIQASIPEARFKRTPEALEISMLILEQNGKILIVSPVEPKIIPGKWGFPCLIIPDHESPETCALHLSRSILKKRISLTSYTRFHHAITHNKICVHVYYGKLNSRMQIDSTINYQWLLGNQLKKRLISSLFQKALNKYADIKAADF
jgi:A/G-specific adenine glycosylase